MEFKIPRDMAVMDAELFKDSVARMKVLNSIRSKEKLIERGKKWHTKKGSLTQHVNKLFQMANGSLKSVEFCPDSKYFCLKCPRIWKQ